MKEYLEGIQNRFREDSDVANRLAALKRVLLAGDCHLKRFDLAYGRFLSAKARADKITEEYEKEVMYALLYEAMDHIYMVVSELDLDSLGLKAPLIGQGLSGEYASEVLSLFSLLETLAAAIQRREKESGLTLDFSKSCDEKNGVTYTSKAHWQHSSFKHYFTQARNLLSRRLDSKPRFWQKQTLRTFIRRKGHLSLLDIFSRIEDLASFEEKKTAA